MASITRMTHGTAPWGAGVARFFALAGLNFAINCDGITRRPVDSRTVPFSPLPGAQYGQFLQCRFGLIYGLPVGVA